MQMPCSEAKLDHLDTEVHVTIQYRVSFYRCIWSICKINLFNCRECSEIQTNSLQRGNFTLSSEKSCLMQKTLPEAKRTQGIDSLIWVISPAKKNASCIGSKFGQLYVVPLVQNLTTRWCHQNWFQIWPTCNAISIGSNFGQQVALLALVPNLTTR